MNPFRLVLLGIVLIGGGALLATRTGALDSTVTTWRQARAVEAAVRRALDNPGAAALSDFRRGTLPDSYCGRARESTAADATPRAYAALVRDTVLLAWEGEQHAIDSERGELLRACGLTVAE